MNPWKLFIVCAIGTCICVNISFLVFALRNPSIPVSSRPYEDGLEYQSVIDSRRTIEQHGWRFAAVFDRREGNSLRIRYMVSATQGKPPELHHVTLTAINPKEATDDRRLVLQKISPQEFATETDMESGYWLLTWKFEIDGMRYIVHEKERIP